MKKYYLESRSRGISYMKYVNGRRTGLVTFCVETAFYNGLLKERYKGGIEVTGGLGRRFRKLLDDLKERRGCCHLKEETLDRTMWRAGFGRGFEPVVRQTAKSNEYRKIRKSQRSYRYQYNRGQKRHFTCPITKAIIRTQTLTQNM
jgi:hypothetical protein